MKTIFYQEMKQITEELKNEKRVKEQDALLIVHLKTILRFKNIAAQEGLLSLEDAANELKDDGADGNLKAMLLLVVDGTAPEIVEDITWNRYFANDLSVYDKLMCLMSLSGILSIQAGESIRILEERIKSLLPLGLEKEYDRLIEEERGPIDPMADVKALYEGDFACRPDMEGYAILKILDYVIILLSSEDVSRLIKKVDNNDISVVFKALSGPARKRILESLPEVHAKMLAEDYNFMGPVRISAIADAGQKIFSELTHMILNGDIIVDNADLQSLEKMLRAW